MRYKLGQRLDNLSISARPDVVPDNPDDRLDVEVSVVHLELGVEPIRAHLAIPPYTPQTHRELEEIHLIFVPAGSDLPADAEGFLASDHPKGMIDVAGIIDGQTVVVQVAGAPAGDVTGQLVLGFKD